MGACGSKSRVPLETDAITIKELDQQNIQKAKKEESGITRETECNVKSKIVKPSTDHDFLMMKRVTKDSCQKLQPCCNSHSFSSPKDSTKEHTNSSIHETNVTRINVVSKSFVIKSSEESTDKPSDVRSEQVDTIHFSQKNDCVKNEAESHITVEATNVKAVNSKGKQDSVPILVQEPLSMRENTGSSQNSDLISGNRYNDDICVKKIVKVDEIAETGHIAGLTTDIHESISVEEKLRHVKELISIENSNETENISVLENDGTIFGESTIEKSKQDDEEQHQPYESTAVNTIYSATTFDEGVYDEQQHQKQHMNLELEETSIKKEKQGNEEQQQQQYESTEVNVFDGEMENNVDEVVYGQQQHQQQPEVNSRPGLQHMSLHIENIDDKVENSVDECICDQQKEKDQQPNKSEENLTNSIEQDNSIDISVCDHYQQQQRQQPIIAESNGNISNSIEKVNDNLNYSIGECVNDQLQQQKQPFHHNSLEINASNSIAKFDNQLKYDESVCDQYQQQHHQQQYMNLEVNGRTSNSIEECVDDQHQKQHQHQPKELEVAEFCDNPENSVEESSSDHHQISFFKDDNGIEKVGDHITDSRDTDKTIVNNDEHKNGGDSEEPEIERSAKTSINDKTLIGTISTTLSKEKPMISIDIDDSNTSFDVKDEGPDSNATLKTTPTKSPYRVCTVSTISEGLLDKLIITPTTSVTHSIEEVLIEYPLHDALTKNNIELVEKFIEESSPEDLNAIDDAGLTPLHVAISMGNVDVVRLICEACNGDLGTIEDKDGLNPLQKAHASAQSKEVEEMIKLLTKRFPYDTERQKLLKTFMDPGLWQFENFYRAVMEGRLFDVKEMLESNPAVAFRRVRDTTMLHLMSSKGNVRMVKCLLDGVPDWDYRELVTDNGQTALHLAVLGNHEDVVEILVDDCRTEYLRMKDNNNCSVVDLVSDASPIIRGIVFDRLHGCSP
eukprot:TRINITY_DN1624_c1_g1_i1.p1 TRINITY_DN1624_c1_g1~~TRINITY_DN1624_c1_g1_i1.p1  ORF type:complete len:959 (-),score=314.83 TRINITY_DN1624_c1_g1_i1:1130-4006(-)